MSGTRGPLSEQRKDVREARGMKPATDPGAPLAIPTCPTFIKGEARREWGRITRLLYDQGRIAGTDRAALVRYVISWSAVRELTEHIEGLEGVPEKYLDSGVKGQPVVAALLTARRQMVADMQAAERDLGLPVNARLRLPVAEAPDEGDELDELRRRREEREAKRKKKVD